MQANLLPAFKLALTVTVMSMYLLLKTKAQLHTQCISICGKTNVIMIDMRVNNYKILRTNTTLFFFFCTLLNVLLGLKKKYPNIKLKIKKKQNQMQLGPVGGGIQPVEWATSPVL